MTSNFQKGDIVMSRNGFGEWCFAVITTDKGDEWSATVVMSDRELQRHRAGLTGPHGADCSVNDPDLGEYEILRRPTPEELAAAPPAVLKLQQQVAA